MDAALWGLLGTLMGALFAILGIVINNRYQKTQEHQRWLRQKKEEVYSEAIVSLLSLRYRRSEFVADGTAVINRNDVKQWFDDYIKVIKSLTQISIYSPKMYKKHDIATKANDLQKVLDEILAGSLRLIEPIPSFTSPVASDGIFAPPPNLMPKGEPFIPAKTEINHSENLDTVRHEVLDGMVSVPEIALSLLDVVRSAAEEELQKIVENHE